MERGVVFWCITSPPEPIEQAQPDFFYGRPGQATALTANSVALATKPCPAWEIWHVFHSFRLISIPSTRPFLVGGPVLLCGYSARSSSILTHEA